MALPWGRVNMRQGRQQVAGGQMGGGSRECERGEGAFSKLFTKCRDDERQGGQVALMMLVMVMIVVVG